MMNFSKDARARIRNALLCGLVTLGLAACSPDEESSSGTTATTATAADSALVTPSVGVIQRPAETTVASTVQAPAAASSTPPASGTNTTVVASTSANATASPPKSSTSSGTAPLDWLPPTENTDGSALTNLGGYTVYYGTSADNLSRSVKVPNPGLTAYTLTDLPPGTWYFAVTSYSSTGVESTRTGTVSTTI